MYGKSKLNFGKQNTNVSQKSLKHYAWKWPQTVLFSLSCLLKSIIVVWLANAVFVIYLTNVSINQPKNKFSFFFFCQKLQRARHWSSGSLGRAHLAKLQWLRFVSSKLGLRLEQNCLCVTVNYKKVNVKSAIPSRAECVEQTCFHFVAYKVSVSVCFQFFMTLQPRQGKINSQMWNISGKEAHLWRYWGLNYI